MNFIYPFMHFLQPGILLPEIADLRPMLVASFIALFVGIMSKSQYPRTEAWTHPAFKWMLVFVVLQVLSLHSSGILYMIGELTYWYVYPMFVVISVLLISNVNAVRRYVWGMILGGMVVVAYGIYSVPAQIGYGVTGRAGAYGMYENHNDFTFIILQLLPFIYMFFRVTRSFILRILLLTFACLCVAGIFMSLSRGGILGLILESLLIVLMGMQSKKRLLLIPFIVVAAIGAISYQWTMREENQAGNYTAEDAKSGRFELWKAGVLMGLKNPFLGTGSRRFAEFAPDYYDLSHDMKGKVSHNTYVEVLAGSGIFGLGSFLAIFYYLAKGLHKVGRTADPWLDAASRATLIGLYTVLFRGLLDAKPHDWSLYVFCAIGLACILLYQKVVTTSGTSSGANKAGNSGPTVGRLTSIGAVNLSSS